MFPFDLKFDSLLLLHLLEGQNPTVTSTNKIGAVYGLFSAATLLESNLNDSIS